MESKKKDRITGKTQKGQDAPMMWTEEKAREYFESRRWPDGLCCVHCGSVNVYRVGGGSHRPGLIECRDCRKQFTVTVGTVMEDSHLPLKVWAMAFHMIATSKKGFSALQLQRNLGLGSYRTAWFLAHRIREAMRCEPVNGMLKGDVQVDETFVGPNHHNRKRFATDAPRKHGRGTTKQPVMVLVESSGRAVSAPVQKVNSANILPLMQAHVDSTARIVTDELSVYPKVAANFSGGHATVNHSAGEYKNESGQHTNDAESFFALLKRGHYGVFHHISKKHMHRYCDEFAFRWNGRKLCDVVRRDAAVEGSEGKRLFYKSPVQKAHSIQ